MESDAADLGAKALLLYRGGFGRIGRGIAANEGEGPDMTEALNLAAVASVVFIVHPLGRALSTAAATFSFVFFFFFFFFFLLLRS